MPIIFITNDIKKDDDWCYLDKSATEDRILAPREELDIPEYSLSRISGLTPPKRNVFDIRMLPEWLDSTDPDSRD